MKAKNRKRRLQARIDSWDKVPASDKTGKSGRLKMVKPGSLKK